MGVTVGVGVSVGVGVHVGVGVGIGVAVGVAVGADVLVGVGVAVDGGNVGVTTVACGAGAVTDSALANSAMRTKSPTAPMVRPMHNIASATVCILDVFRGMFDLSTFP